MGQPTRGCARKVSRDILFDFAEIAFHCLASQQAVNKYPIRSDRPLQTPQQISKSIGQLDGLIAERQPPFNEESYQLPGHQLCRNQAAGQTKVSLPSTPLKQ